MNYIIVSLGAAFGGGLRYWISNLIHKYLPSYFPYGTLVVNIVGSFLLGLIIFYFDQRDLISSELRLFLAIGFCGGFTTFSTFSFETMSLFRDSQFLLGIINILLSLILTFAGIYLAYIVSKY
ncbi:MAG TPA: fluoride efflux transporter CrcB [Ignavibacteriaceae bacterium]|jgi:CrcB protein|nr:fluoride efflux transporter CrcB [Ignavibacteriaceae bacterium]